MAVTWSMAQSYCRHYHQDLSAVLEPNDNHVLADELQARKLEEAWIGLYRDAWKWSDGTASSFRRWAPNEPNNDNKDNKDKGQECAAMNGGSWYDWNCDLNLNFLCQGKSQASIIKY